MNLMILPHLKIPESTCMHIFFRHWPWEQGQTHILSLNVSVDHEY